MDLLVVMSESITDLSISQINRTMPCQGITSKGEVCNKGTTTTVCGTHAKIIHRKGPNQTALDELKYKTKKIVSDESKRVENLLLTATADESRILQQDFDIFTRRAKVDLAEGLNRLGREQRAQIEATGVDPDAPARERARTERERRNREWNEQRAIRRALHENGVNPHPPDGVPPPPPANPLARFSADPQNVHTNQAVMQTKDIVEHVRKIPVPEGYRWNTIAVSKTIGEIISECQLTSHAAAQMFNQYVSTVAVYNIEEGIYGKVLDSVWQYIKASPDKEDLCKILKNEMTDNIGMCAQGNLSRICNILAGYLDGVGCQESLSDLLGRLLAPLADIDDEVERIRQACVILKDNRVPYDEWLTWTEPLIDECKDVFEMMRDAMIGVV